MAGDSAVTGDSVVAGAVASGAAVAAGFPAGVTVSVFCSQAASNAALARIQMYFFIIGLVGNPYMQPILNRGKQPFRSYRELERRLVFHCVRFRHGLAGEAAITRIDPAAERGVFLAGFLQAKVGQ